MALHRVYWLLSYNRTIWCKCWLTNGSKSIYYSSELDWPFSQLYADRVQAIEGTQAASIGSEIQMWEHRSNVHEFSSPTGGGWSRDSVRQISLVRSNGRGGGMTCFPSECRNWR